MAALVKFDRTSIFLKGDDTAARRRL